MKLLFIPEMFATTNRRILNTSTIIEDLIFLYNSRNKSINRNRIQSRCTIQNYPLSIMIEVNVQPSWSREYTQLLADSKIRSQIFTSSFLNSFKRFVVVNTLLSTLRFLIDYDWFLTVLPRVYQQSRNYKLLYLNRAENTLIVHSISKAALLFKIIFEFSTFLKIFSNEILLNAIYELVLVST